MRKKWLVIFIITENYGRTKGKIWSVMSVDWSLFQPLFKDTIKVYFCIVHKGVPAPPLLRHPPLDPACPPLFKIFVSPPLFSVPPPFKLF